MPSVFVDRGQGVDRLRRKMLREQAGFPCLLRSTKLFSFAKQRALDGVDGLTSLGFPDDFDLSIMASNQARRAHANREVLIGL